MDKHQIERADIMAMEDYGRERAARRRAMTETKRHRRLAVGPDVTFYFENYDTMWYQVHEMLHIEGGGEGQIEDELRAYNPLIPKGKELVATFMIEIDDEARRNTELRRLTGVETTASISFDNETVVASPEEDVQRTAPDGKTSSIHFLHFPFTGTQVAAFRRPGTRVVLGIDHPAYGHMAVMPEDMRAALAADFD